MKDEIQAMEVIDKWFSSNVWCKVCEDADTGDEDSIELMERVNDQLQSLVFHLNNNSGDDRIRYEVQPFVQLCEDFDVPLWL